MSDPNTNPQRSPTRRPSIFPVVTTLLLVLAALLVLARFIPGPRGQQVTVLETGTVGTSK